MISWLKVLKDEKAVLIISLFLTVILSISAFSILLNFPVIVTRTIVRPRYSHSVPLPGRDPIRQVSLDESDVPRDRQRNALTTKKYERSLSANLLIATGVIEIVLLFYILIAYSR